MVPKESGFNCTERLHVDARIMRSFQTELFSCFLPYSYAGNANLAAAKPWQCMSNWKHDSTVEFIMLLACLKFCFCLSIVSYIIILL